MSELWDALLEVEQALPAWWRYVATAGGAIGLSKLFPWLWRWLHSREKPFRCGPFVWKRNKDGDVFAGFHFAKINYPCWATGKWVEDDAPAADREADSKNVGEEDQPTED